MSGDPRYDYPPRRRPRQSAARPARREVSRYRTQPPPRSTSALTVKLVTLATVATLAIGGLIAVQMANGADPTLGPKAKAKASSSISSTNSSTGSGSSGYATDPYGGYYGDGSDGYSGSSDYGDSSGYGYSSQPQTSSPAPVTSSTS
jgi:hypothetical protein